MLTSLRVGDHELLKQADGGSGTIPRFGSFILAPWVGELHKGLLRFSGRTYQLPTNVGRHAVHGLVFSDPWTLTSRSAASAILERKLDEPWPFGGLVRQQITLTEDAISLVIEVLATEAAMPASVGWHPWFSCTEPAATRVLVHAHQRLELDDELIPTGRYLHVSGISDLRTGPILGGRAIDNVYVDVVSPAEIDVPGLRLSVAFDAHTSIVVVYTSPGSVCVEPWSSWPDASRMSELGYRTGVTILERGETLRRETTWSWQEAET